MSVDLFTVLAQVANFLILALLLKRFLYGPILRVMREREERIAVRVRESEEALRQAREERKLSEQARRDLEASRERLLEEARQESAAHRRKLEEEARLEIADLRRRWHTAVEREKEALLLDIRRRTEAEALALARQALAVLSGEDLDSRIAERFLERLGRIGAEDEAWPLPAPGERVLVRSAHELPGPLRERLREALSRRAGGPLEVEIQADPDLVGGIEVAWRGHKLAWSLLDFLESVEERLEPETAGAPSRGASG